MTNVICTACGYHKTDKAACKSRTTTICNIRESILGIHGVTNMLRNSSLRYKNVNRTGDLGNYPSANGPKSEEAIYNPMTVYTKYNDLFHTITVYTWYYVIVILSNICMKLFITEAPNINYFQSA